jgi:hypothetical protein
MLDILPLTSDVGLTRKQKLDFNVKQERAKLFDLPDDSIGRAASQFVGAPMTHYNKITNYRDQA